MAATLGRLLKRSEFLAVAAFNRRWTTPGLVLQVRPRPNDSNLGAPAPALRVGFTATKKIGNAVIRNRARRRLRAAVREVLGNAAATPADIVLIARHGTCARPYADLKADIQAAASRLGVIEKPAA